MFVKRLAITALLTVGIIVPAMAQKNELSGIVGGTFISDQGIRSGALTGGTLRFGKGTTVEANYARRLLDARFFSVSAEVPFVLNPDEDWHTFSNPLGDYRSYFVTPAARVNAFPDLGVSPWVSVGGGVGHFSATALKTANTTGILEIGAGLDVKLIKKFSLRGEVRDFWSGVPQLNIDTGKSRQHNYLVGGGVVWHF